MAGDRPPVPSGAVGWILPVAQKSNFPTKCVISEQHTCGISRILYIVCTPAHPVIRGSDVRFPTTLTVREDGL